MASSNLTSASSNQNRNIFTNRFSVAQKKIDSKTYKFSKFTFFVLNNSNLLDRVEIKILDSKCIHPFILRTSNEAFDSASQNPINLYKKPQIHKWLVNSFAKNGLALKNRVSNVSLLTGQNEVYKYLVFGCLCYANSKIKDQNLIKNPNFVDPNFHFTVDRILEETNQQIEQILKEILNTPNLDTQSLEPYIKDNHESIFATNFVDKDSWLLYTPIPNQDFYIQSHQKWEFMIFCEWGPGNTALLKKKVGSKIYYQFDIEKFAGRRVLHFYIYVKKLPESRDSFLLTISTRRKTISQKIDDFLKTNWIYLLLLISGLICCYLLFKLMKRWFSKPSSRVKCVKSLRKNRKSGASYAREEPLPRSDEISNMQTKSEINRKEPDWSVSASTSKFPKVIFCEKQMLIISEFYRNQVLKTKKSCVSNREHKSKAKVDSETSSDFLTLAQTERIIKQMHQKHSQNGNALVMLNGKIHKGSLCNLDSYYEPKSEKNLTSVNFYSVNQITNSELLNSPPSHNSSKSLKNSLKSSKLSSFHPVNQKLNSKSLSAQNNVASDQNFLSPRTDLRLPDTKNNKIDFK